MSKVIIISKDLKVGGVQKSLVELVRVLSQDNTVDLFLFSKEGMLISEIPDNVNIYYANDFVEMIVKYKGINKNEIRSLGVLLFKTGTRIFELLKLDFIFSKYFFRVENFEYDYLINYSGYKGVWERYCELKNANKKFYWIHNDPKSLNYSKKDFEHILKKYNCIIVVSSLIKKRMIKDYDLPSDKIKVIYNLIDSSKIRTLSQVPTNEIKKDIFNIVTVIRLQNESKRVDRLLESAKILKQNDVLFKWYIIGEGPDLNKLKNMATRYDLNNEVIFTGVKENPYNYIFESNLFVLTSDYEGLPVTLMEAEFLGTKIVTTNFESAKEIITTSDIGYVVDKNPKEIAKKIIEIYESVEMYDKKGIEKEYVRNKLGERFLSDLIGDFRNE